MPDVRIAAAARRTLFQIYDFSRDNFGKNQANAYFAGLERAFSLIADFPKIGTPVDALHPGFRR
jgi:plasmid stabilization system protein ParE